MSLETFDGNAAVKLPEQPIEKSNEELLRELKIKQNSVLPGEVWTPEDGKRLLELQAEVSDKKPLSDMEKARLHGLRKIQFEGERQFTADEVIEFEYLTKKENRIKKA